MDKINITPNALAEIILDSLRGNRFANWYENQFGEYLMNNTTNQEEKEKMHKDIIRLFNLETVKTMTMLDSDNQS